jgi:hypothetical protein
VQKLQIHLQTSEAYWSTNKSICKPANALSVNKEVGAFESVATPSNPPTSTLQPRPNPSANLMKPYQRGAKSPNPSANQGSLLVNKQIHLQTSTRLIGQQRSRGNAALSVNKEVGATPYRSTKKSGHLKV